MEVSNFKEMTKDEFLDFLMPSSESLQEENARLRQETKRLREILHSLGITILFNEQTGLPERTTGDREDQSPGVH